MRNMEYFLHVERRMAAHRLDPTRDTKVRGWYMDIVRELAVLPELKEEAG